MNGTEITVVYQWTAHPGRYEDLKAIYAEVFSQMESDEPDALKMECYFADESKTVIVHDVFRHGGALGFHLGGTAAQHFPRLMEIAVPGPFFFCGDVPAELKAAAESMNMGAVFGSHAFGFTRDA